MKRVEFNDRLEQLTRSQKPVLKQFLAGKTDKEITDSLSLTSESTTRKHLSNVCKVFGLSNGEGEHYSYRNELIDLFLEHQPDWVAPEVRSRVGLRRQEAKFPGRPVALDSPFYIEHSLKQEECYQEIRKPSSLIRIKSPKKMGKTSLLNRILAASQQQSYRTVYVDLRKEADQSKLNDLDRFLRWFCASVSRKLELPPQLDSWDSELFGSKQCCIDYFQNLLEEMEVPLVLAIDEVDVLFPYLQTAEEFFALLRGWYEEQNDPETWGKLRQVIAHSTALYTKLNINQSPFNVGLPIQLPKLTGDQVLSLAQRYGLKWSSDREVEQLMKLVGGHPYLIQLALYHLEKGKITLEELFNSASTPSGIYQNHLQHLWESLQEPQTSTETSILTALKQVIASEGGVKLEPEASYKLQGLGLVDIEQNQVKISCELYRQYFRERLL